MARRGRAGIAAAALFLLLLAPAGLAPAPASPASSSGPVLEPAAAKAVAASAKAVPIWRSTPEQARRRYEKGQRLVPVDAPGAVVRRLDVPYGRARTDVAEAKATAGATVRTYVYRPAGAAADLPAVVYLHGGGWILGGPATHDRLVRQLATRIRAAVVLVDYSHAPGARFPVALNESEAVVRWLRREGRRVGIDPARVAVAGDSAGGAMAAALAVRAERWPGPRLRAQVLLYPVTDAGMNTASYREFATGYSLTARTMRWFWEAYVPDPAARLDPAAAPLRATDGQLAHVAPALVVTAEADVLRDEGEAYAYRLRAAGNRVLATRYPAIVHDFLSRNNLYATHAAHAALRQVTDFLAAELHDPLPASRPWRRGSGAGVGP
ncbi:alpha/beta hydrolase [Streptomyces sp. NPDC087440]|uniref:alpha/beta hydrolase n=1 Tax=Streptomyces sp. NPDC087440 TaxID=3365790 RepID=UPI00380765BA